MGKMKPHLSRRSLRWKTLTNAGEPCKYYVYEIVYGKRTKPEKRVFLVVSRILTQHPTEYANHPEILREINGWSLIEIVESHTGVSWITIGRAVEKLFLNKDNDK